jgi:hypothetical protein
MITVHKKPEDLPGSAPGEFLRSPLWSLANADELHARHPRSYFIPDLERRKALLVGECVRLEFHYGPDADREQDRPPDIVVRAPGPYSADQDAWWIILRERPAGATIQGVNGLTDRFPGLAEPLRASAGLWELTGGGRERARWRLVSHTEVEASEQWPRFLRWLESTAERMRMPAAD